ncbi:hypothetical protein ACHAXS_005670 [Conticribra weissflogii]
MTSKLSPGQRILQVDITHIGGKAVSLGRRLRKRMYRNLQDEMIEVLFNVVFEQFCQHQNCDDGIQLTEAVLDLLVTTIDIAIEDSSLLNLIKMEMNAKGIDADTLAKLVTILDGGKIPTFVVKSIMPMLYYPDWTGGSNGCIADGNEEAYMRLNPEGFYLFDTLEDCCSRHFSWDYNNCAAINTASLGTNGEALYYPDWGGVNKSCKNDGRQPSYMSNDPSVWMYKDLKLCCKARYSWNLNECMGTSEPASTTGSKMWYPDWKGYVCVQDCVGAAPCGGLAENWDPLYNTVESCCNTKLNWVTECVSKSGGTITATSGGTTVAATSTTSKKWYVDYDSNSCKQDCVGAAPCGGAAESWEDLYPSVSTCCKGKLWWVTNCSVYSG